MARRFLTPINLLGNELQNARVQNLASSPASPAAGQIYFDTTTGAFRFYDGAQWVDVVSQEGLITQVNVEAPITSTGGSSPTIGIVPASGTEAGSMSATDKTKLDGVATGATANDTDANLRDRSTHTGTQGIDTVSGLQTELDSKVDGVTGDGTVTVDNLDPNNPVVGISNATQTDDGSMSSTDKTKLDGVESGATANSTDATLLARGNHTGTQAMTTVDGLGAALDGKQNTSERGQPDGYAPLGTNGLVPDEHLPAVDTNAATLEGQAGDYYLSRANHTGTQAIATVDGLQTALDAKVDDTLVGAASGVASLDANGLVPVGQIPALAISETFVVASEAAMLALDAQTGDVAVRTDIDTTFILEANDPTLLANWVEILTPDSGVQSVSGGTGITSSGGANPSLSITAGGVGTTELADDNVTEAKLEPAVRDKINAPQGALKHAETIGDGIATEFTITHNMGTRDVQVQVFQTGTPYGQVETDVRLTTTNSITIVFAQAPAADTFRVVVVG